MQKVTVLAHPAEPAADGPAALQDRGAVDEPPSFHLTDFLADSGQQRVEFAADDVVVVVAVNVAGDPGRACRLLPGREIVHQQGDDRSGTRYEPGGVDTEVEMIFHIFHRPVAALAKPALEP